MANQTFRIYVPSQTNADHDASGDSTLTGLTWNSSWTAAAPGGVVKHRYGWADITNIGNMPPGYAQGSEASDTETSLTFSTGAFASSASRYGMRIYLGPMKPGLIIVGGATLTGAMNCRTGTFTNTVYLTQSVQIRNYDDTLGKTVEAVGTDWRDATVWTTSFTSRWDQATAAATNYTTVKDDWILWELGVFNDFLDAESRFFEVGFDPAGTDATSTDSTSRRNSFLELTYDDTGTAPAIDGGTPLLTLLGVGT